jgi:hypothetical protein
LDQQMHLEKSMSKSNSLASTQCGILTRRGNKNQGLDQLLEQSSMTIMSMNNNGVPKNLQFHTISMTLISLISSFSIICITHFSFQEKTRADVNKHC